MGCDDPVSLKVSSYPTSFLDWCPGDDILISNLIVGLLEAGVLGNPHFSSLLWTKVHGRLRAFLFSLHLVPVCIQLVSFLSSRNQSCKGVWLGQLVVEQLT